MKKSIMQNDKYDLHRLKNFFDTMSQELNDQHFELRPQQKIMANTIFTALANHEHALIEAGTGTGKTLAYLVPAVYHALTEKKVVVIATNTIVLQKQILERDILLIENIIKTPVKSVLFKGRNNYLCINKLQTQLASNNKKSKHKIVWLNKVNIWEDLTDSGDKDDSSLSSSKYWSEVHSDADNCAMQKCSFFKVCYYQKVKNQASKADIIITNHSLVMTDIKVGQQILPKYDVIIFDEAHHLEKEATKHLGIEFRSSEFRKFSKNILSENQINSITNLLIFLAKSHQAQNNQYFDLRSYLKDLIKDVELLALDYEVLNKNIMNWLRSKFPSKYQLRLTKEILDNFTELHSIELFVEKCTNIVNKAKVLLEQTNQAFDDEDIIDRANSLVNKLSKYNDFANNLNQFFDLDHNNNVHWFEFETQKAKNNLLNFIVTPVYCGTSLKEKLYDKINTVIFTSATISVAEDFTYTKKRLGLHEMPNVKEIILSSPFYYSEQCRLWVTKDLPDYNDRSNYICSCCTMITNIINNSPAKKTLILFTSNQLLNDFYKILKAKISKNLQINSNKIQILAQLDEFTNKSSLVQDFLQADSAILLGCNSFWEGVDFPREYLQQLIIVRLPFWPPDLPIVEARTELLKSDNKNPFTEYALPEAVIRFKQGFGRLIRTQEDVGAVLVLDERLHRAHYRNYFIRSIPDISINDISYNDYHDIVAYLRKEIKT